MYWDVQNVLLEDVEQIEVIRGPGSTLWGANAVNGIINIITKTSKDTQGGLLTGGAGDKAERVVGGFRYGGKISKDAYYRLYTRYLTMKTLISDLPVMMLMIIGKSHKGGSA